MSDIEHLKDEAYLRYKVTHFNAVNFSLKIQLDGMLLHSSYIMKHRYYTLKQALKSLTLSYKNTSKLGAMKKLFTSSHSPIKTGLMVKSRT